jgi:type I restriction enzyme M protein
MPDQARDSMLTGELRSQVDAIWNAFWSGGIANPIEVIEQITYLLFQRRLDDLHTLEERQGHPPGQAHRAPRLPAGRRRQGP